MAFGNGAGPALNTGTQRLFFALWPDAGVRKEMAALAGRMHRVLQGRCTRADSIHLTLAFIGNVDADKCAILLAPPPALCTAPFVLTLDQWGCWPRNGVGWLAPSHAPQSLHMLAANLACWLRRSGFELESRAFFPHVTLVRKAVCGPLPDAMAPISWPVNELTLIRSEPGAGGSRYRVLRAWPLDGPA
jgi:2'-5' RNA ligase